VRVVEVDRERGRIGLRLAHDPAIAGKSVEELAGVGTGTSGGGGRPSSNGRDRGERGGRREGSGARRGSGRPRHGRDRGE
jgi:polyribonucleotide nucleotidyltransferase